MFYVSRVDYWVQNFTLIYQNHGSLPQVIPQIRKVLNVKIVSIYYPFDSDEDSDGEDVGGDAEQAGEGGPHPHHGEQLRRRRHGPRQVGRQGRVEGRHQLGGSHRHG